MFIMYPIESKKSRTLFVRFHFFRYISKLMACKDPRSCIVHHFDLINIKITFAVLLYVDNNKESPNMSQARIIVSRSHAGDVEAAAKEALGDGIVVTPAGGAGYKTWEVVKGVQDAYIHTTLIKKWDICAGGAILGALGGKMTTLKGDTIDFSRADQEKNEGGLLATMHNHEQFLDKLKVLGDKRH